MCKDMEDLMNKGGCLPCYDFYISLSAKNVHVFLTYLSLLMSLISVLCGINISPLHISLLPLTTACILLNAHAIMFPEVTIVFFIHLSCGVLSVQFRADCKLWPTWYWGCWRIWKPWWWSCSNDWRIPIRYQFKLLCKACFIDSDKLVILYWLLGEDIRNLIGANLALLFHAWFLCLFGMLCILCAFGVFLHIPKPYMKCTLPWQAFYVFLSNKELWHPRN